MRCCDVCGAAVHLCRGMERDEWRHLLTLVIVTTHTPHALSLPFAVAVAGRRRAFQPLVAAGYLEVVYGGGAVGQYLCRHDGIASGQCASHCPLWLAGWHAVTFKLTPPPDT